MVLIWVGIRTYYFFVLRMYLLITPAKVGSLLQKPPAVSKPSRSEDSRPVPKQLVRRLTRAGITSVQFDINFPSHRPYIFVSLRVRQNVVCRWFLASKTPHAEAHHSGDSARFSAFGVTNNNAVRHGKMGQLARPDATVQKCSSGRAPSRYAISLLVTGCILVLCGGGRPSQPRNLACGMHQGLSQPDVSPSPDCCVAFVVVKRGQQR